jgi:hypothetical protein
MKLLKLNLWDTPIHGRTPIVKMYLFAFPVKFQKKIRQSQRHVYGDAASVPWLFRARARKGD